MVDKNEVIGLAMIETKDQDICY